MTITQFKFENMVTLQGNQVMTTSLKVAKYFGRKHKTILRAIRNLNCSKKFNERNFVPVNYIDEKGEAREMYNLTKDGCIFLIMGFTGEKAAQIKEAYIDAFNWMAEQLTKMQHSYMKQHNDLMLEYMKEKDVASMSGRLLRRWGKEKKPELTNRMQKLQEQSQIQLLI
ncbi:MULTISPECIES: Rha family transcriptional regulator [unclassified Gilliamella]|uniref:Rha family transcriptional regulator n=1 Tax=unclassified Gilliamella TaxID=2685620 RepID=UPI000A54C05E|nr:Rha family transcriptional regulator [Gilliamella apicola]